MAKTATFLRRPDDFKGDARLYILSEPTAYDHNQESDYVIVSAVIALMSGPETYIFPANEEGEVIDWGELEGSFRGGLDHEKALTSAGYEVR